MKILHTIITILLFAAIVVSCASRGSRASQKGLSIDTPSDMASQTEGQPGGIFLEANGGTPPYHWEVVKGAIPDGMKLSDLDSNLYGTPTYQGVYRFRLKVVDGAKGSIEKCFTLDVEPK